MSNQVYTQQQKDKDNEIVTQIQSIIIQQQKNYQSKQETEEISYQKVLDEQQMGYVKLYLSPEQKENLDYKKFRNTITQDFERILIKNSVQIQLRFISKYQVQEDVSQNKAGIQMNQIYMCQFQKQQKVYQFFITQYKDKQNQIVNVFYVYDIDFKPDQIGTQNNIKVHVNNKDSLITIFLSSSRLNKQSAYDMPALCKEQSLKTISNIFEQLTNQYTDDSCKDFECQKINRIVYNIYCIYVALFAYENNKKSQMQDIIDYYIKQIQSYKVNVNLFEEGFTQYGVQPESNGITVFNPDFVQQRIKDKQSIYDNWIGLYYLQGIYGICVILVFLIISIVAQIKRSLIKKYQYNIISSVIFMITLLFIIYNMIFTINE